MSDLPSLTEASGIGPGPERRSFQTLIGRTIVIRSFTLTESKFEPGKKYAVVEIEDDGKRYIATTSIPSVVAKLIAAEQKLPVKATVVASGRFYDLV
jgi:enterochelin esterase-like enzyme